MKKKKLHISDEPHCRDLESIGSVVMPLVKGVLSTEDFVEADIAVNWFEIIGEEIGSFCSPLKVRYNQRESIRTLFVEVPVGGFALELQHREKYILEKINAYFGYQAVHRLNISQNIKKVPSFVSFKTPKKVPVKLKECEENYLQDLSDGINDEKLKEILIKLGKSIILSQRGADE